MKKAGPKKPALPERSMTSSVYDSIKAGDLCAVISESLLQYTADLHCRLFRAVTMPSLQHGELLVYLGPAVITEQVDDHHVRWFETNPSGCFLSSRGILVCALSHVKFALYVR